MAVQAQLWGLSALAVELDMDRRTVAKHLEDLAPDKISKTKKRVHKQWKLARVLGHLAGDALAPQAEKARLDRLRADKVEFDLGVARREVAPLVLLEAALSDVVEQINSLMGSLPLQIKKQEPVLKARTIEFIRRRIVKLQNEISKIKLR